MILSKIKENERKSKKIEKNSKKFEKPLDKSVFCAIIAKA
jgi:hypothetical protein